METAGYRFKSLRTLYFLQAEYPWVNPAVEVAKLLQDSRIMVGRLIGVKRDALKPEDVVAENG